MPRQPLALTKECLEELLIKHETAVKMGKALGCHPQTVRKYLKMYNLQVKRGPKPHSSRKNRAKFFLWLKTQSNITNLPHSITALSSASGVSKDAVRNHLYRVRLKARKFVGTKPWLSSEVVVWEDIGGIKIPDIAFDTVRVYIGQSGILKFHIRLCDNSVRVFKYTKRELEKLYRLNKGGS